MYCEQSGTKQCLSRNTVVNTVVNVLIRLFRINAIISAQNHLKCHRTTSVVVPYCSCCLCLYFGSPVMLVTYFVNFR